MRSRILALIALTLASAWAKGDGVIDIVNKEGLDAAIAAHPAGLAVLFHKPDCERCEAVGAVWNATVERLQNQSVALGRANAAAPPVELVAQFYEVRTFPTILVFRKGIADKAAVYTGRLTADVISATLLWQGTPPLELLQTKDDVSRFLGAGAPASMIAYVPSDSPSELMAFSEVYGAAAGDVAAAYITDRSLLAGAPCTGTDCDSPVVVMHKPGEKVARYEGEFEGVLISKWAVSHVAPLVARYSATDHSLNRAFERAFRVKLPRVIGIFQNDSDIDENVVAAFTAAAEANDDLKFFLASRETGRRLVSLAVTDDSAQTPIFAIVEGREAGKVQRFIKTGMRVQDLPEFIEEYKVGALEAAPEVKDPAAGQGKVAEQAEQRDEL